MSLARLSSKVKRGERHAHRFAYQFVHRLAGAQQRRARHEFHESVLPAHGHTPTGAGTTSKPAFLNSCDARHRCVLVVTRMMRLTPSARRICAEKARSQSVARAVFEQCVLIPKSLSGMRA